MISAVRQACPAPVLLKTILETGELKDRGLIRNASHIAIQEGADFIKTSTGKVAVNATLEAADIMLTCIRESGRKVGFKSGRWRAHRGRRPPLPQPRRDHPQP